MGGNTKELLLSIRLTRSLTQARSMQFSAGASDSVGPNTELLSAQSSRPYEATICHLHSAASARLSGKQDTLHESAVPLDPNTESFIHLGVHQMAADSQDDRQTTEKRIQSCTTRLRFSRWGVIKGSFKTCAPGKGKRNGFSRPLSSLTDIVLDSVTYIESVKCNSIYCTCQTI